MPGTVKCRPTVAYWVQIDGINIATELITRYYLNETLIQWSNAVLMLGQRLRRWPNIEPTSNKCTMFERKSSCSPANTRHLYNIYTMSAQRFRRWYKCFVFTECQYKLLGTSSFQISAVIQSVCLQASDQVGARAKCFELLTHRCRSSIYELAVIWELALNEAFGMKSIFSIIME